jgi:hypothetical protein
VTDPVNLRTKLEQLLAQHAILTVRLTRARLRDDADLAQTAEEALTKNTDEFGALVESAYGSAAAERFKQRWFTHVTLLFNYARGVADGDDSVTAEVRAELAGYTFGLSTFLEEATKHAARASVVRPELETHVDQLLQQTDAYSQGDYGRVFALERESYAHMPYLTATLATLPRLSKVSSVATVRPGSRRCGLIRSTRSWPIPDRWQPTMPPAEMQRGRGCRQFNADFAGFWSTSTQGRLGASALADAFVMREDLLMRRIDAYVKRDYRAGGRCRYRNREHGRR